MDGTANGTEEPQETNDVQNRPEKEEDR